MSNIFDVFNSLAQGNLSTAVAHATEALEHLTSFISGTPTDTPPPKDTSISERLITLLTDFLYSRTALENTSLLLALTTFAVLAMSWASRLGNLGRFSPFTRSPPQGSTKVSDSDFSYITADDLRRHQAESVGQSNDSSEDHGPARDTDVLVLRKKKQEHAVHFPAYSIAKGELTIGQVRDQAAKKVGAADVRRIKLLYKGRHLKDDARSCKQEGLRNGAEVMLTVAEIQESDSEDDDDELADGGEEATEGEPKRRRNRGKKSKRRNKREERDAGASGTSTPQMGENLGVPSSQQPSRTQSPKPPATPLEKLNAVYEKLQTYLPDVRAFQASPPSDPAKKEFEHKRLSETILAQVLLKLDAVETEGDADARSRRKELVKEAQKVLGDLDAVMKG